MLQSFQDEKNKVRFINLQKFYNIFFCKLITKLLYCGANLNPNSVNSRLIGYILKLSSKKERWITLVFSSKKLYSSTHLPQYSQVAIIFNWNTNNKDDDKQWSIIYDNYYQYIFDKLCTLILSGLRVMANNTQSRQFYYHSQKKMKPPKRNYFIHSFIIQLNSRCQVSKLNNKIDQSKVKHSQATPASQPLPFNLFLLQHYYSALHRFQFLLLL